MNELIETIITYLETEYQGFVDVCGEDDNINTLPCYEALEAARELKKMMKGE